MLCGSVRAMMTNKNVMAYSVLLVLLLSMLLSCSSEAVSERVQGKSKLSAEPKRSYGAVNVIMYQTSW